MRLSKIEIFSILPFLALIGCSGANEPADNSDQESLELAQYAKNYRDRQQADKEKGFHCLSANDGSSSPLVDQVKLNLRDPASFEHSYTEVGKLLSNGNRPIKMEYRAANGFGGMNVDTAIGALDQDSCTVTIITDATQLNDLLPAE
ncbi:hypothetical protein [Parasphingorhabdus sp.]|uniref:hypothetical protein n=1 Tax=Parasphingorhabdus sp. TaxID=2709688 RepID=UPI0035931885